MVVRQPVRGAPVQNLIFYTKNPLINTNRPPVVSAGPDLHVAAGAIVSLFGDATDPDGSIDSVAWQQSAGVTDIELTDPDTATASFTAPNVGETTVLGFEFGALDDDGAVSIDTLNVWVDPPASQDPLAGDNEMRSVPEDASAIEPARISVYEMDDLGAGPTGTPTISGQLLVDFVDTTTRSEMDLVLVANGTERVGVIPGLQIATAKITDGRDELTVQADLLADPPSTPSH